MPKATAIRAGVVSGRPRKDARSTSAAGMFLNVSPSRGFTYLYIRTASTGFVARRRNSVETRKWLRLHARGIQQASESSDTMKAGPAQELVVDVRTDYHSLMMEP